MREDSTSPSSSISGPTERSILSPSVTPNSKVLRSCSEQKEQICSFYAKIGACRHGSKCSRLHTEPKSSHTVLLRNFYRSIEPFLTAQLLATADGEREFEAFYYEVFTELEREYGLIDEMNVCENIGEHLIGNVYIKFEEHSSARKAVDDLNQRWFARQAIYAELSPVVDFRDACCRQHEVGECSRGGFCNFMHIKQPSMRILREVRSSRLPRKRRRLSSSSSSTSSSSSSFSFSSQSDSGSSLSTEISSLSSESNFYSDGEDDSDAIPKNYRSQYSSSEDESDSEEEIWKPLDRSPTIAEDSDPDSTTPRAFRPIADDSSDDGEMSESEREMIRRRKQKIRRQRWEELRDEFAINSRWDEDRERNFVFSLL